MKIWTTKDGTEIPYNQLTLSHIYNIIKWAKYKGFYEIRTSNSIVDNMDDVITSGNISERVISEMREELKRRGYSTLYYTALVKESSLQRVSIIFDSFSKALQDIQSRKSYVDNYILVKETIL